MSNATTCHHHRAAQPGARRHRRRRGISLMLVMTVIAVASVLGMAILTSNSIQTEASRGQDLVLQADALAESGVNVGLYYLQNINDSSKCPNAVSAISLSGPVPYNESSISLGAQVPGTYDLSITRTGLTRYVITSTGNVPASTGNITRKIVATVDLNYYTFALSLNNSGASTTINAGTMTVTGDVYSAGPVVNAGTVTGTIYSNSVSGAGTQLATKALSTIPSLTALPIVSILPNILAVNHYPTYIWTTGTSKASTSNLNLSVTLSNTTKNPSPTNPAGIYTYAGDLNLDGGVTINGTLVVSGKLKIAGNNTINPRPNFPAIIVDSDIAFKTDGATLTSNGLTFVGGQITRSGAATANLNVTGTLISSGGAAAFDPLVTTNITYDRSAAAVPSLSVVTLIPIISKPASVSIVSWQNQQSQ
jgi:cytoskeletal protein CcmA (bactofilin family)